MAKKNSESKFDNLLHGYFNDLVTEAPEASQEDNETASNAAKAIASREDNKTSKEKAKEARTGQTGDAKVADAQEDLESAKEKLANHTKDKTKAIEAIAAT
jgi:ribosomal protein L32